mgnify:CR=1 FL=1|jgi:hypothetical protein|tara:strand:+ start:54 stop:257 length:204 start_codon:yes stop_codon:yes gene_type:complete
MLEWYKHLMAQHQGRLNMSKTGNWLFGMQEDAYDMTRNEFISAHGLSQVEVWDEVQDEDFMEMDDGA